jgi:triosephosphate isomerase
VRARPDIVVGAQNIHWELKGAFTGEVSLPMVQEAGATAALVGHSERRHLFGETDDQVARKTAAALNAGLTPLVCVGETLAEREGGRTEAVILRQLAPLLERVSADDWVRLVVAYEPVWAIGTGRTATPDDAAQVHELIRFTIARRGVPARVRILYGGSVNPANVPALLARPELDGVLVGGASVDPDGWAELVGLS